jgi:multidrug efflux pump subunit AcrB
VPLSDIVSVTRQSGFSTVRRENGLRLVSVTGDLSEDDPARAVEIQTALTNEILPQISEDFGVTERVSGLSEQENRFLSDAVFGFSAALMGIYLTLAWIFSSWTRPIVVMAVIPFGLIGAIYGHAFWDVPLSMFSVVGLIGMTGIIINDSIVLVTTIDEYAEERGIFPAIVDATTDRLRPVMLTTLTTVLGLAPLLFERSADAQFLKPTVITLVYGLGFGMVIVLLLVPAILSMQVDVARYIASLRRAMQKPKRFGGVSLAIGVAIAGVLAWFSATLGHVAMTGVLPQILGGGDSMMSAIGVFLLGLAVVLVAIYAVAVIVSLMRRKV